MQKLHSHCTEALQILAHQYLCHGKTKKAQALLELLVVENPANSECRLALGYALLSNEKPHEALKILAIFEASAQAVGHFLLARALAQMGRIEEAQAAFARYRGLRNKTGTSRIGKGLAGGT